MAPSKMGETVCVVGLGAMGLAAVKIFTEDGFDATGFELRDNVSGIWVMERGPHDTGLSALPNTVFNSSRYRSHFSDLPFDDATDEYPTAEQMGRYLEQYADHFKLRPRLRLGHRVLGVQRKSEQWAVRVEAVATGQRTEHLFDRVCIATGYFNKPRSPTIAGIERFAGTIQHAINFRDARTYADKNVLIVGLHASATDVLNALHGHAKHVFLSHRHGVQLATRWADDGAPFDTVPALLASLFLAALPAWLFTWLLDTMLTKLAAKTFPGLPAAYGLTPAQSVAVSPPLIADDLAVLMSERFAEPCGEVARISGPDAVQLTDGRTLTGIDAIVYCTGYTSGLANELIPTDASGRTFMPFPDGPEHPPRLYQNVFPLAPDERVRNTIAYACLAGTFFPGLVQFEARIMALSQTWVGNSPLPSLAKMEEWYERNTANYAAVAAKYKTRENNCFYVGMLPLGEHFHWMDKTAGAGLSRTFGAAWFNRHAWALWWSDTELYNAVLKGMFTPVIWRLVDTGKRKALPYQQARQMIFAEQRRLKERTAKKTQERNETINGHANGNGHLKAS